MQKSFCVSVQETSGTLSVSLKRLRRKISILNYSFHMHCFNVGPSKRVELWLNQSGNERNKRVLVKVNKTCDFQNRFGSYELEILFSTIKNQFSELICATNPL